MHFSLFCFACFFNRLFSRLFLFFPVFPFCFSLKKPPRLFAVSVNPLIFAPAFRDDGVVL